MIDAKDIRTPDDIKRFFKIVDDLPCPDGSYEDDCEQCPMYMPQHSLRCLCIMVRHAGMLMNIID